MTDVQPNPMNLETVNAEDANGILLKCLQQGEEQNLCYKVSENVWKIGVRPAGSENANQSSEGQENAGLPRKKPRSSKSRSLGNRTNNAGSKRKGSLRNRRKEARSRSTDTDSIKSEGSMVSEQSISETMSVSIPGGPFRSNQQQGPPSKSSEMQMPPQTYDYQVPQKAIKTEPGIQLGFNAPFIKRQFSNLRLMNTSTVRVMWLIKSTSRRILIQPVSGVIDQSDRVNLQVLCEAFDGEPPIGDHVSIEWIECPASHTEMNFDMELFEAGRIFYRKSVKIEYNI